MRTFTRMFLFAALVLLSTSSVLAQTAIDPSGHWEGAVRVRNSEIRIEIDLAKNSKGQFAGTFGQPAQGVKGLPISAVAIEGRSITFVVKADASEPGMYEGVLSEDGESISGDLSQLGYVLPFSLKWTGVARIAPVPRNASIGKELEGTWNGALDLEGKKQRLILKMTNQPDGTATGTIMSPDGSGVDIPIGMTQKGSSLTIDVSSIGASFVGNLDAAGTELVGTLTQSSVVLPLTFRRAAK